MSSVKNGPRGKPVKIWHDPVTVTVCGQQYVTGSCVLPGRRCYAKD